MQTSKNQQDTSFAFRKTLSAKFPTGGGSYYFIHVGSPWTTGLIPEVCIQITDYNINV